MMDALRNLARRRYRDGKRAAARREAIRRFMSAFFFGAVLATLAAIVLVRFK